MKGTCSKCGDTNVSIDMHHPNYESDVTIPLCRLCHRRLHSALRKNGTPLSPPNQINIGHLSITHEVRERVKRFANIKDETYSSILTRVMDDSEKLHAPAPDESVKKGAETWINDGSGHIPSVRMTNHEEAQ